MITMITMFIIITIILHLAVCYSVSFYYCTFLPPASPHHTEWYIRISFYICCLP
jgi:hypothetical protein